MAKADAVNPLGQVGNRSWIIELPKPRDDRAGKLVINPDQKDRAGFTPLRTDEFLRRLPGVGGFHDAISGCLVDIYAQRRVCGPTLLDTGTEGVSVTSHQAADVSNWTHGARMVMTFLTDNGTEFSTPFISANTGRSTITAILRPNQPRTRIMAGTLPYFSFAVLYDERNGVIGLKSR